MTVIARGKRELIVILVSFNPNSNAHGSKSLTAHKYLYPLKKSQEQGLFLFLSGSVRTWGYHAGSARLHYMFVFCFSLNVFHVR